PEQTGCTKRGRRQRLGIKQFIDAAPEEINKEAETEYTINNGWHTSKVVNRNPDQAEQRPLLGIFTQINCSQNPQRRNHYRHNDHHSDRAKYSGKNSPFRISLTRLIGKKFP